MEESYKEIPGVVDWKDVDPTKKKPRVNHTKPDPDRVKQQNRNNNRRARKQRQSNRKK